MRLLYNSSICLEGDVKERGRQSTKKYLKCIEFQAIHGQVSVFQALVVGLKPEKQAGKTTVYASREIKRAHVSQEIYKALSLLLFKI